MLKVFEESWFYYYTSWHHQYILDVTLCTGLIFFKSLNYCTIKLSLKSLFGLLPPCSRRKDYLWAYIIKMKEQEPSWKIDVLLKYWSSRVWWEGTFCCWSKLLYFMIWNINIERNIQHWQQPMRARSLGNLISSWILKNHCSDVVNINNPHNLIVVPDKQAPQIQTIRTTRGPAGTLGG